MPFYSFKANILQAKREREKKRELRRAVGIGFKLIRWTDVPVQHSLLSLLPKQPVFI